MVVSYKFFVGGGFIRPEDGFDASCPYLLQWTDGPVPRFHGDRLCENGERLPYGWLGI